MSDFRLHLTEKQYAELAQYWHEYRLLGPARDEMGLDQTSIALRFSEWIDVDEDEPHYGLPEILAFFDEKELREGTRLHSLASHIVTGDTTIYKQKGK